MKTLSEVLTEGQISYATLTKYRDMGLIPAPIRRRGKVRGSCSLYKDETVSLIHYIEIQKAKGMTLSQIRHLLADKETKRRKVVASKPNPDELTWGANILRQEEAKLRRQGKDLLRAELVKSREKPDGTVDVHLRLITVPRGING